MAFHSSPKASSSQRFIESRKFSAFVIAAATALLLMTLPWMYWASRADDLAHELAHQVEHAGDEVGRQISDRLHFVELVLRGVRGFIDGSDSVNATEFQAFVNSLQLETTSGGLVSVTYAPYVAREEYPGFKALAPLLIGQDTIEWRPEGDREAYAPVLFIEPRRLYPRAHGFDILSMPVLRDAALRARDTGLVSLSASLPAGTFGQTDPQAAFVMYAPIYRSAVVAATEQQRQADLRGWAGARFRLADLLDFGGSLSHQGLLLQLFDGNGTGPESFLFGWQDGRPVGYQAPAGIATGVTGSIEFGGRRWTYRLTPTPAFFSSSAQGHHALAALGVLLSLATGYILWLLMTARDRALRLANDMTREWRQLSDELASTLNAVPDLLFEMDGDGRYLAMRSRSHDGLAIEPDRLIGQTVHQVLPPSEAATCMQALRETERTGSSLGRQIRLEINGEIRWFELSVAPKSGIVDGPSRFIVLSRDITERHAAQEQLHRLAFFDSLTQLPNRSYFMQKAAEILENPGSNGGWKAVIMIDLDHFKVINEHWGPHRGDAILVEVVHRLQAELTDGEFLARLDGDEFIVFLPDAGGQAEAARQRVESLCTRLLAAISRVLVIDGSEQQIGASLGALVFGNAPLSVEALLSQAGSAMHSAKTSGRNTYRFFDGRLKAQLSEQAALEADLRSSIARGELQLLYQPQVDRQGRVIGAEALCRWVHPERGSVSPAVFIPLAESSGFIQPLGQWVLESACRFLAGWSHSPGSAGCSLSVNVSARQFHHPDFLAQVRQALQATGANPAQLKLELTESIFSEDVVEIVEKMALLKQLGVTFSLDDFGTGYSSLNYLKTLPIDQLKIDQSFVRDLLIDRNDEAIARTVIALGKSLGLGVIAEGVETPEQHSFLLESGCEAFQGYLFGRPVPGDDFLGSLGHSSRPD